MLGNRKTETPLRIWARGKRGRLKALAEYLDCSFPYVSALAAGTKYCGLNKAAAISAFTAGEVPARSLRNPATLRAEERKDSHDQ